jgi:hypothetical protein
MSEGIGNEATISELDIRLFLRDNDPDLNYLLDDFEFTPEELRSAMQFTVDKWNETPPAVAHYTVDSFPWRHHYMIGVAAQLLNIAGFRYQRNDLNYSVPGGAVNDQNKGPAYFAKAKELSQQFDAWMHVKKTEIQVGIGWAAV